MTMWSEPMGLKLVFCFITRPLQCRDILAQCICLLAELFARHQNLFSSYTKSILNTNIFRQYDFVRKQLLRRRKQTSQWRRFDVKCVCVSAGNCKKMTCCSTYKVTCALCCVVVVGYYNNGVFASSTSLYSVLLQSWILLWQQWSLQTKQNKIMMMQLWRHNSSCAVHNVLVPQFTSCVTYEQFLFHMQSLLQSLDWVWNLTIWKTPLAGNWNSYRVHVSAQISTIHHGDML